MLDFCRKQNTTLWFPTRVDSSKYIKWHIKFVSIAVKFVHEATNSTFHNISSDCVKSLERLVFMENKRCELYSVFYIKFFILSYYNLLKKTKAVTLFARNNRPLCSQVRIMSLSIHPKFNLHTTCQTLLQFIQIHTMEFDVCGQTSDRYSIR